MCLSFKRKLLHPLDQQCRSCRKQPFSWKESRLEMASKDRKKQLAVRKQKVGKLVDDIEIHDQDRSAPEHHAQNFLDPKFTTKPEVKSTSATDESTRNSSVPSAANASPSVDRFSTLFETESEEGKTGKGRGRGARHKVPGKAARAHGPTSVKNKRHPPTLPQAASNSTANLHGIIKPQIQQHKLSEIFRQSEVSVRVDDDSDPEGEIQHAVEALMCLDNLNYVFMQRLLDYEEVEAAGVSFREETVDVAYQVMSLQGNLLFLLEQHKVTCSSFILYAKKSFENWLFDIRGTKVLKFTGPSMFMSKMISKMLITDANNKPLGYVKAFGKKCNYSVYNAVGERMFLVVSNSYIPSSATVFSILSQGQKIGVIKYGWKHTFHDLPHIDYETVGMEVSPELDGREKALLIGCMMLIEFTWYNPLTKLKLSMLIVGLLLVAFAVVLTLIPLIVDKQPDNPQTKSYYTADSADKT